MTERTMYAATVNNMPRTAHGWVTKMEPDEVRPSDPSNKFVHHPPSDNTTAWYSGTFETVAEARRVMREWFGKIVIHG